MPVTPLGEKGLAWALPAFQAMLAAVLLPCMQPNLQFRNSTCVATLHLQFRLAVHQGVVVLDLIACLSHAPSLAGR